jgi:hypothetical protein
LRSFQSIAGEQMGKAVLVPSSVGKRLAKREMQVHAVLVRQRRIAGQRLYRGQMRIPRGEALPRCGEADIIFDASRLQRDRLFDFPLPFLDPADEFERQTEIVVRLAVIGLEAQSPLAIQQYLAELTAFGERDGETVMGFGAVGIDAQRTAKG